MRVFDNDPALKIIQGPQGVEVNEVNPPKKAPEKVFEGEVVFKEEPTIKGKKLSDWFDSEGGVTQEELDTALALKQDKLDTESAPSGVVTKLIGFNSEGKVVSDDVPEGIVVDDSLNAESNNAIANKPVAEKFAQVDEELETKANVDGNYPTMTVGVADQLSPYDDESGDDQDEPFSFQATGTGNGSQPDFSTGAIALLREKQGNTVVVNQLLDYAAGSYSDSGIDIVADTNGVYTITGTATADFYTRFALVSVHLGHKSLIWYDTVTPANESIRIGDFNNGYSVLPNKIAVIYEPVVNPSFGISIKDGTTVNLKIKPRYIDLTQWFGSNDLIPAHLLSHSEDFFRYYQGSLAYNEGTLVNANGRYLKTIGRNQWDEEWAIGEINGLNGTNTNTGNYIRSENFIRVVPNTDYYAKSTETIVIYEYDKDKNYIKPLYGKTNDHFKVEGNCCFIKLATATGGTTYNHDITISIYYEGESGYDEYYPYEELSNIDTGTETLRSAGSVKDAKTPDGTITRRVGVVDLGSLEWVRAANDNGYMFVCVSGSLNDMKPNSNYNTLPSNFLTSKYTSKTYNYVYYGLEDKIISPYEDQTRVAIIDNDYTDAAAFKTAMSGVYLFYELATSTTEQGTTFSENVAIDDFGSMDFGGTNGVPQGARIFYAVDYKAFVDSLYNYTDGTPSNLAKKTDISSFFANITGYDATKTQTLKNVNGTLTWVDDE